MWRVSQQQYNKHRQYANRDNKYYSPIFLDIPDDNFPSYGRKALRESKRKFKTVAEVLSYADRFNRRVRLYNQLQANLNYAQAGSNKIVWNKSTLLHLLWWRGQRLRLPHAIVIPQEVQLADVSLYQGDIDWSRFTLRGAIIKAGQRDYPDPKFLANWTNAKAHGVPRGSYWFFDSRKEPRYQAALWASLIAPDQGELLHCADYEENYGGPYAGSVHFRAFLEEFQRLSGLPDERIAIYTGYYYWIANSPTNLNDLNWFRRYELWLAWYTTNFNTVLIPRPWDNPSLILLQWTDSGDGYGNGMQSSRLDLNWFNGTVLEYETRFGLGNPPPTGGIMQTWIVNDSVTGGLKVRSGPGVSYGQVQSVWPGDRIEGELNTTYNWINISRITRVSGTILSPAGGQWWCSGNSDYVTLQAPPPAVEKKVTKITAALEPGSSVTILYDDGSQENHSA